MQSRKNRGKEVGIEKDSGAEFPRSCTPVLDKRFRTKSHQKAALAEREQEEKDHPGEECLP
jgi:hypothetical protein